MVAHLVLIARSIGAPTIAGERYFTLFEQDQYHTHSKKTAANADLYLEMFEEARSAAYAIVPEGSFRSRDARIKRAQEAASAWSQVNPTQAADVPLAKARVPPIPPRACYMRKRGHNRHLRGRPTCHLRKRGHPTIGPR